MERKVDRIIYGGAFNPPTIAHKRIGMYLCNKYKDALILYMPTNSFYNKGDLISFNDRFEMTKLLVKDLGDRVAVSNYEGEEHKFSGTYYTLKEFGNPYFVIGADALQNLSTWIKGEDLIKENNFIVFPRSGFNIREIFNQKILKDNIDHFIVIDDYQEDDISSTAYRNEKDKAVLTKEVYDYIKKKGLYR